MSDPKVTGRVASLLTLTAVLLAGAGGYFHFRAWRLAEESADATRVADETCYRLLVPMGAVERTPDGFRVSVPDIVDPRARLADASAIVAACPDLTLSRFCLGKGCGEGAGVGLVMEMRRAP